MDIGGAFVMAQATFQSTFSVVFDAAAQFIRITRQLHHVAPAVTSTLGALGIVIFIKQLPILFFKTKLIITSSLYMVLSKDSKWKWTPPPRKADRLYLMQEKYVVFIRHGESEWNLIFNKKPKILLPFRLIAALIRETMMFFTSDSLFFDSPLNKEGMQQAVDLENVFQDLSAQEKHRLHDGSVYVSSNLRRALTTLLLSFQSRFQKSMPKVRMWSCLQEISRNIDTQSLTAAKKKPAPSSGLRKEHPTCAQMYDLVNVSEYNGNKSLSRNGLTRMKEFCQQTFQVLEKEKKTMIVVGGHSLWFKNFFKTFLPEGDHENYLAGLSRTQKIKNGGAVQFILQSLLDDKGNAVYRIRPESLSVVHKGFEEPKKKK